jgi:glycogen phosphorylase
LSALLHETARDLDLLAAKSRIAYFTMEIALRPEVHTYSGGLGILAGDTARSCADLELPVVFVTLISRGGYMRQAIDPAGRQLDGPDPWNPADFARPLGAAVAVVIEGQDVWIRPWLYVQEGGSGYRTPVILLDVDLAENAPQHRGITDRLYGGDEAYRLQQEIVLGIGGVRVLRALGFDIDLYHLNEGHSALLALELLHGYRRGRERPTGDGGIDVARVRRRCIFTTHTPVEAGHDRFGYALVSRLLGDYIEIDQLRPLGGADHLNMTRLALNLSGYVNGVAKRHAELSARLFAGYRVHAITNGVHAPTWACPSIAALFHAHLPEWQHEPEILVRADQLPADAVWQAHEEAKATLLRDIAERSGVAMEPGVPLLGFARRITGYKRPDLIFADVERLRSIHRQWPLQIVIAGKAHPHDAPGCELVRRLHDHMRQLAPDMKIVFLANYDMAIAQRLVAGVDVWLNTPLAPLEASGTSGMKAALNGVLNLSILDGWWLEAWIEGRTGWAIGRDGDGDGNAAALYDKLEQVVLPLYYRDRSTWVWMMKEAIAKIAYYFNSHRMMRRYASEAYLR